MRKPFTVYVLVLRDGAFYVGQTKRFEQRMKQHGRKYVGSPSGPDVYVRAHGGVRSVVKVSQETTREQAEKREKEVTASFAERGYEVTNTPTVLWLDTKSGELTDKLRSVR